MGSLNKKVNHLEQVLKDLDSILVAFSGGVDSAFLLKTAKDVLGKKAVAVTLTSEIYPAFELEDAKKIAKELGVEHIVLVVDILSNPEFVKNPTDRCYICKKGLFSQLKKIAKTKGIPYIIEGSNFDDLSDFRPGRKALEELDIKSPLLDAKLTKEEIRKLSKDIRLFTWNKPSCACLATRIPYDSLITSEKLNRIEKGEDFLRSLGIRQVRVRDHNELARIEVLKKDMPLILKDKNRTKIVEKLTKLGYHYITLDLQGYRTGSMNKAIVNKG